MTPEEYKQLNTYSRYDGFYLSVLWIVSFVCLMKTSLFPPLALGNELLMLATPFFVFYRLRKYRNEGLGGTISFRRALAYCGKLFLNASLIFGIAQWLYMRFVDGTQLFKLVAPVVKSPEYEQMFRQMGMTADQYLQELEAITPTSFAISCLVMNLIICAVLSVILAAIGMRNIAPAAPSPNAN